MRKKKNEISTQSMEEFGRFMKFLRCPEIYQYKLKMAERFEAMDNVSGLQELYQSDLAFFDELFPDEELPETFRELQASARRYKLKMYSLRDLADALEISKNTLHDYEQGKRYPSVEFIYDYCEVLKIPVDEVLNEWLRCHPKENIRGHASARLENYYFHNLSSSFNDEKRVLAREFFAKALLYSFSRNHFVLPDGDKVKAVAKIMGVLIDGVLAQGLSLEPDNIQLSSISSNEDNIDRFDL
ncbi:helix-turn-helix domain-containing protein [Methylophaga nitratireducenticrescens]|uniref:Uncharacterized protein n=1 Tax=Methylophaga nitratireducenticrescens TaxID=754476 RepID=I1XJV6_METNJ|nr:helix-turn-helix transcriptional regulator [Methylophaga nitratireducenticrescens]AFI84675.1 transcriptional regulator [Methylophaga nitratireducenticrescens]AUZ84685.1 transcriptional regulator [Methylophaga nitratireducenticrescens]